MAKSKYLGFRPSPNFTAISMANGIANLGKVCACVSCDCNAMENAKTNAPNTAAWLFLKTYQRKKNAEMQFSAVTTMYHPWQALKLSSPIIRKNE